MRYKLQVSWDGMQRQRNASVGVDESVIERRDFSNAPLFVCDGVCSHAVLGEAQCRVFLATERK
jgi:hypothetical protein